MQRQETIIKKNEINSNPSIQKNEESHLESQLINHKGENAAVMDSIGNSIYQKIFTIGHQQTINMVTQPIHTQTLGKPIINQIQKNDQPIEMSELAKKENQDIDLQEHKIQSINYLEKPSIDVKQQLISPLRKCQLLKQQNNGQKENLINVQNYNKILMSIHSSKSEVGYLDEEEDKQITRNSGFEAKQKQQQLIQVIQMPEQMKTKKQQQFIKVDINQVEINKQSQQKVVKIEKEQLQQVLVEQMNKSLRVTILSQQPDCHKIENSKSIEHAKPIESQILANNRKLSLVHNINVTISVDSGNKPIKQLQSSALPSSLVYSKSEGEVKIQLPKVQPLDIKTLSVLTLSSPQGIDSIKPPSPKADGERKAKPWQRVSKMKSIPQTATKSDIVSATQPPQNTTSIPSLIPNVQSNIQNQVQKQNNHNFPINVSDPTTVLDSNIGSNQQKMTVPINIATAKSQDGKINGKIQSKEQYLQLKQKYAYLKSIIPANAKPEIAISKPSQQHGSKIDENRNILKEEVNIQRQILTQQKKIVNPSNKQLELQPHISLHHPLQNKKNNHQPQIDLTNNSYKMKGEETQKKSLFSDQIEEQIPLRNMTVVSQNLPLVLQQQKPSQKQEQQQLIKEQQQQKKSEGSQIINDESFEDKKIEKQNNFELKKRLQELQQQIEKQKQINRQLQKQSSFVSKFGISLSTSLLTGGMTYVLRRDKLGSIIFALAIGVSTFILKK